MRTKNCPYCDYLLEEATPANTREPDAVPVKGSVSVCMKCGGISIFNEDLSLHKITDEEREDIKVRSPMAHRTMMAMSDFLGQKNRKPNPINLN